MSVVKKSIFRIKPSFEEDRTMIDFELSENIGIDWTSLNNAMQDVRCRDKYKPFDIFVQSDDALQWDFYSIPGTLGLISNKAVELIRPYTVKHFSFLDARLNGKPYQVLVRETPLDCLNLNQSEFVPFPGDSARVLKINKYHFKTSLIDDPLLFSIPESLGSIFATQSIIDMVKRENLHGLFIEQVG